MPKLLRNGVNIHYEVHGSGPAILLSHGYSATARMWDGQIDVLSAKHTLILWDMRGHGESDYPDEPSLYSEAETIADMHAILDAAGAERAVIGGLSLGGYMSLAYHRAHPVRARALLIVDTGPGYRNDEARAGWNDNALRTAARFERDGLAPLQRGSAERARAQHRSASGLVHAARGMLTQRDARVIESLPDIEIPALVVVGSEDTPFLKAADHMASRIPHAEKVVIPGAGHAANIDRPELFNSAILRFLEAHKL